MLSVMMMVAAIDPPRGVDPGSVSAVRPPVAVVVVAGEDAGGRGAALGQPGEILVTARRRHEEADPLAPLNAKSFAFTQDVDMALVGPVALAYKRRIPEPVRDGLRNALRNLNEPVVFVNFLLQHKLGKAAETLGRFVVNSTAGAAGLFDVARRKPFYLPRRPNGLAYTLGFYGVKPGAFLFLPLIGPTTVRDMVGAIADRMLLPTAIGFPFNDPTYTIPAGAVSVVDRRAEFEDDLETIRASEDPYIARRQVYLRKRQREIDALHARPVTGKASVVSMGSPAVANGGSGQ